MLFYFQQLGNFPKIFLAFWVIFHILLSLNKHAVEPRTSDTAWNYGIQWCEMVENYEQLPSLLLRANL